MEAAQRLIPSAAEAAPRARHGLAGELRRYAAGLTQIDPPQDEVGAAVFGRQLDATTYAWKSLVPLAVVFVVIAFAAFWHVSNRPIFLLGALAIILMALWGWRALPQQVAPTDLGRVARRHTVTALGVGIGWGLLGAGATADAHRELVQLVTVVQMALMAVGLIMYTNLPVGFVGFSTPVAVTLVITSTPITHGGAAVTVPLVLVYYAILAKAAVDQGAVFVEAQRTVSRLADSELARRDMARAAEQATEQGKAEARAMAAEQLAAATREAEERKRASLLELATRFETEVAGTVELLSRAVADLDSSAAQLASVGEQSAAAAADVAQRATAASTSAGKLAVVTHDLGQSIAVIAEQVDEHALLSKSAHDLASSSASDIDALSGQAERISGVIQLVEGVAAQTKLLALNATIEAARAGVAGNGFAVVAGEVKALATRTTLATGEVRSQSGTIVARIGAASTRMAETAQKIDGVAAIAGSIAASVTQQRQAAMDIDHETDLVASHIDDVRGRADELAQGARVTGTLASGMNQTVRGISQQATALRGATTSFLDGLRMA